MNANRLAGGGARVAGLDPSAVFGQVRRDPLSVRSPTFTELRDRLLAPGLARVEGFGADGEPLTHEHRRTLWLVTAR